MLDSGMLNVSPTCKGVELYPYTYQHLRNALPGAICCLIVSSSLCAPYHSIDVTGGGELLYVAPSPVHLSATAARCREWCNILLHARG